LHADGFNGLNHLYYSTGLVIIRREDMKGAEKTEYFHVCTDGRLLAWMFQDNKDFIAGINRIGICHIKTMAAVLCFVLMDNHVHFVLKGTMHQCKNFINLYKRLTGRWIMQRYGITDYLRLLPTDIIRITSEESLLNTIAYIDRNAVVAGYRHMPGEYPWGSAKYIFREKSDIDGRRISSYTRRVQKEILHSNIVIPGDWIIDAQGMIHPACFMDISITESYFKSPIRYTYFLSKKLEGMIELDLEHAQKTFIPDKEMRQIVKDMIIERYQTADIRQVGINERLQVARTLKYKYACTVKQICRMVHMEKDAIEGFV
jgi:REP element-mobilizing transposase RayT